MNLDVINRWFFELHEMLWHMDWTALFHDVYHSLPLRYLLLLWIFLHLGRLLAQPHRKLCIAQGKAGKLFLQKSALKDLLIQTCFDQGIRTRPHIAIRLHPHRIELSIHFKILQHQSLQDLGSRLQFELQRLLVDELGVAKKLKIHLFVTGFLRSQQLPTPMVAKAVAPAMAPPETPKFLEKP
ncbi:MAG: hypothetical protein LBD54_00630 [Puniceicoccales bacterium]|jgi:hypothetical protein|nr:hypothetical protein [Puniceicoccales bacterium]